jgi:hypothetical protein
MGSLAGTDAELDIHPPQKTLCRIVRLNTRTVRLHARTGIIFGLSGAIRGWSEWVI